MMQIVRGTDSCRNALRSNLLGNSLVPMQRRGTQEKGGGTENKRKQSVLRLHVNLPKLNGLMGGSKL